ncbi:LOW QUALITY PROTEIN: probable E3 ubiquitin-protein ligase HERC4 [Diadema antillarum]|uniref:LOW QUALITY PROTEIN: probable E3 ubiquitin-protein ligase HERC4 n=1 Tax=Diadema antillarum TaxID=105358 RepID=UPI003A86A865
MFCWGSSREGQLGLGNHSSQTHQVLPKEVPTLMGQKVQAVGCGLRHTGVVLQGGTVYMFGANDMGQLGQDRSHSRPVQVSALETFVISQVCCGGDHTLAVSDRGQVLGWGRDDRGQCGLGTGTREAKHKPKILRHLGSHHVVKVCCGELHSMALSRDGRVFTWGDNTYGQLGIGSSGSSLVDRPTELTSLKGVPIVRIACGGSHSFALTVSGSVFSWGKNDFGQLGLGNREHKYFPTLLRNLRSQLVRYVACGQDHTALLTLDGGVFLFGQGSEGQLGHGSDANELNPKKVIDLMGTTITQVACGRHHTLVLEGASGRLYAFGLGVLGQLGQGDTESHCDPAKVSGPWVPYSGAEENMEVEGYVVRCIHAGGGQSFCTVTSVTQNLDLPLDFRDPVPHQEPAALSAKLLRDLASVVPNTSPPPKARKLAEVVFSSAACLNASFLKPNDDHYCCGKSNHGVDLDAARSAFKHLSDKNMILEIISEVITSTLVPSLPESPPDVEALRLYLVLMECPVLSRPQERWCRHTICQLGNALCSLKGAADKILTHWWAGFQPRHLNRILTIHKDGVMAMLQVGSFRQLRQEDQMFLDVCMRVLDKLCKVNNNNGEILPYYMFYIPDIGKYINIQEHFLLFLQKTVGSGDVHSFTFCDYPFVFDTNTKTQLLHIDALLQMKFAIEEVRQRNLERMISSQIDPVNPCLVLCINRKTIVPSTINQLSKCFHSDFKKPLKVVFIGEEAVDAGGVRKEFFMLIMREILDPKYGMFRYFEDSGKIWFNNKSFEDPVMFRLVGLVCGLAIYNHIIISLPFPLALYKKLLKRKTTLEDFKQLEPQVAHNLQAMLDYEDEESFSDTFPLVFQIDEDNFGQVQTTDLAPNGGQKEVTAKNRQEYVDAYVDYTLNTSVGQQFTAFSEGFLEVCGGHVLDLFHPQELMAMVVGDENYDWDEFEKSVEYKGQYYPGHRTIRFFWQVFREMPLEAKKKFLVFLTGNDHIPIQGWKSLQVIIQPVKGGEEFYPVAHTCFNLLDLPMYTTKEVLKEKLLTAIEHTQGFTLA